MEPLTFHDGRVELYAEDCLAVLKLMPDCFVDAVITDPPYHLTSIVKRFGGENAAPAKGNKAFVRASRGFMGQQWDGGDIAFRPDVWRECLRVLKPGGHLAAFSGCRTYHRMACAIEDAGFEVREQLAWVTGQGFPKSHNVSRTLDGARCSCERDSTDSEHELHSLRERHVSTAPHTGDRDREILLAGLSQSSASTHGPADGSAIHDRTGESGMEGRRDLSQETRELRLGSLRPLPATPDLDGKAGRLCDGTSASDGRMDRSSFDADRMRASQGPQAAKQSEKQSGTMAGQPEPQKRGTWDNCERCGKPIILDGLGTALKPAWEPICLARKPLSEGTVAANVLRWGTGAINVDACRVGIDDGDDIHAKNPHTQNRGRDGGWCTSGSDGAGYKVPQGRFPANLVHDGSPEVLAGFPETGASIGGGGKKTNRDGTVFAASGYADRELPPVIGFGDRGSAARFFYCAKASKKDRAGSNHPTVKPISLMAWLVRMLTPPGGLVLDPFAGTGTLAAATFQENTRAILIEREELYRSDIVRRVEALAA